MAVMIGIDPHKATHTAVVVDQDEHVIDETTIRASRVQADRLGEWADRFGERVWAVESAQGLGYLLAQQLTAAGETVFDVPPVLASLEVTGQVLAQRVEICRELVDDIARYDVLLKASSARIRRAVVASGTTVTEVNGVGPIGAAMIIGQSGDIDRFASRAHYASYNATAPIEASSGPTKRHRLNPRGNRQLNWAIHIAAITPAITSDRGSCLLRAQGGRGQDEQGSDPGVETTDL